MFMCLLLGIRLSYAFIVSRSTIKLICIGDKRKRKTRNEKREMRNETIKR